ncbi:MAG: hypothetical protein FGF48_06695 [Candidatus Brockarchaeota archaeon]|nr:hypothetical protein [Candidatus Brockarchaeota archaeon]
MHDPDVVILLFASGKLVCTGAVNEKMVYDAAEKLMQEFIQKGIVNLIRWRMIPNPYWFFSHLALGSFFNRVG